MNVKLQIENDAELRGYIKECIKGQVLSIVREEFMAMVKEEIERKIKGSDKRNFERMQEVALKGAMESILRKEHSVSRYNDVLSRTDWNGLVNQIVVEKIKSLIK